MKVWEDIRKQLGVFGAQQVPVWERRRIVIQGLVEHCTLGSLGEGPESGEGSFFRITAT